METPDTVPPFRSLPQPQRTAPFMPLRFSALLIVRVEHWSPMWTLMSAVVNSTPCPDQRSASFLMRLT